MHRTHTHAFKLEYNFINTVSYFSSYKYEAITKKKGEKIQLIQIIIIATIISAINVIAVFCTFKFQIVWSRLKVVAICYYQVTALFIKLHVLPVDRRVTIFRIFHAFHRPGQHKPFRRKRGGVIARWAPCVWCIDKAWFLERVAFKPSFLELNISVNGNRFYLGWYSQDTDVTSHNFQYKLMQIVGSNIFNAHPFS